MGFQARHQHACDPQEDSCKVFAGQAEPGGEPVFSASKLLSSTCLLFLPMRFYTIYVSVFSFESFLVTIQSLQPYLLFCTCTFLIVHGCAVYFLQGLSHSLARFLRSLRQGNEAVQYQCQTLNHRKLNPGETDHTAEMLHAEVKYYQTLDEELK